MKQHWWVGALVVAFPLLLGQEGPSGAEKTHLPARLRRPVALALAEAGRRLYVANRGGSVSVIDVEKQELVAECDAGRRLSDLAILPDGRLLATDEEANELLLLSSDGQSVKVAHRLKVSPMPVSVRVTADSTRCFVASLWSRQLSVVELSPTPGIGKILDLPFAPRQQLLIPDGSKLIVADAFGGRLAVMDVGRGEVESVRELPAHNLRGLAWDRDGKHLLLTHQALNPLGHTTRDDIHWGNVLTNHLRVVDVSALLKRDADLLRGGLLHQLGDVGKGAGDPAGVTVAAGKVVVALAGVNEVAVGDEAKPDGHRLAVGRRPTAVLADPVGRRAYVANTFGDSVSVIDLKESKVITEVALGPAASRSESQRGEEFFYDARLTHDGWFSCHSCHTDGHSCGRLTDNLGDGSFGAPKRMLSLLGVKDTGPWAWDGGQDDLAGQVRKSLRTTMHGPAPKGEQVKALTGYLHTLAPPPSLLRLRGPLDEVQVERGRAVFEKHACGNCHAPPEYTSPRTYNVALKDEVGNTHFNPPSLRGISQGGPYFHDGRAATLDEVFTRHKHQLQVELSSKELADLLYFLRSL